MGGRTGVRGELFTMKQVCESLDMTYETLRFYCDEGLVPNLKRDKNNYRLFDGRDVRWLQSLQCLRRCGMGIKDMKRYMELCLEGEKSIPERKAVLERKKELLLLQMEELRRSIRYIEEKQAYFDGVLAGEIAYSSNLICASEAEAEPE